MMCDSQILQPLDFSDLGKPNLRSLGNIQEGEVGSDKCSKIEILIVKLGCQINRRFLCNYRPLKPIASPTTGTDHIDHEFLSQKGVNFIEVREVPKALEQVQPVVEEALCFVLSVGREVPVYSLTRKSSKIF